MKTAAFDFDLPPELIATKPAEPRDSARMLVLKDKLQDALVKQITDYIKPGDVVVLNNTKVIPARLIGKKGEGKVEVLLHKKVEAAWQCFAKPAKRLKPHDTIVFSDKFTATVQRKLEDGQIMLQFNCTEDSLQSMLEKHGQMPLPPYIEKQRHADISDQQHYQTVFAQHEGSVAAPTAGLHFTDELLVAIERAGATIVHITLHVGGGTFLPVKAEDTKDHVMHSEWAKVTEEAAHTINKAKASGGRVLAVGTTAMRTLESAADENGVLQAFEAETDIFITPGYSFKMVDILLTNFHLPRSTLFMLVCAFSGTEEMKALYNHAVKKKYRFYSYGDACLLHRKI